MIEKQLELISEKWPQLADECQNQMPVDTGKKFKYKIGQIVPYSFHSGREAEIIWRWHGRSLNYYDILFKDGSTWTLDEEEIMLYEMTNY